jgi:diguanylate cyclase (GGDEF)-like protein
MGPVISETCRLATVLIGRYLATGESATAAETHHLAERSTTVVVSKRALADVTKNYLTWRDETLRVVREESERLGSSRALIDEASAVVRYSCDVSIVRMSKEFDAQRGELQLRLDAERDKLTRLALHDGLTGLANRALLLDRLNHEIAGMDRRSRSVGVLYLDLDGFKAVNDDQGHEAGDSLLVAVAERLSELVRPTDTVARLGGDEFAILCVQLERGAEDLEVLACRVRDGCGKGLSGGVRLGVSMSVGGAMAVAGDDAKQVLARADAAMYGAKRATRDGTEAPSPVRVVGRRRSSRVLRWARAVRRAAGIPREPFRRDPEPPMSKG